jgi:hypothetical protein
MLDVSGAISHSVFAIIQIPSFVLTNTLTDLVYGTTANTADGSMNGNMNLGKGISVISAANTPGTAVANSVIKIDYPGFYLINTKFNNDTTNSTAGNISIYIYLWIGSAWTQIIGDELYTTYTASCGFNSTNFIQLYTTPPYYLKIQKYSTVSLSIGSGPAWTSLNIVKIG